MSRRGRGRGPQLRMDDDESEDEQAAAESESDSVDSDVEKLAAESVDRRRQATIDAAVSKAHAEGIAALEDARRQHAAERAAMEKEHAKSLQAAEIALRRARHEGEVEAEARMEATLKLEDVEARAKALEERLMSCEAERDELESGILRARDICATKDAEVAEAAERGKMSASEAVAESKRLADEERDAAVEAARRELAEQHAATLAQVVEATRGPLEQRVYELEMALVTAHELTGRREQQLLELEERAAVAVRKAVEHAGARIEAEVEARCAVVQKLAVKAAMEAATSAQERAVATAVRSAGQRLGEQRLGEQRLSERGAAASERASAVSAGIGGEIDELRAQANALAAEQRGPSPSSLAVVQEAARQAARTAVMEAEQRARGGSPPTGDGGGEAPRSPPSPEQLWQNVHLRQAAQGRESPEGAGEGVALPLGEVEPTESQSAAAEGAETTMF